MVESNRCLNRTDVARIAVLLVGITLITTAFFSPWWTRGFTVDFDDDLPRATAASGYEGQYFHYGTFYTPGDGAFSTDGHREAAAGLLGAAALVSALFALAAIGFLFAQRRGRLDERSDAPVRFAIVAFLAGLSAVLVAALLLPVAGPNPGWMYGAEAEDGAESPFFVFPVGDDSDGVESGRFANVGFFAGILAFVAWPAYLWADAARVRAVARGDAPAGVAGDATAF